MSTVQENEHISPKKGLRRYSVKMLHTNANADETIFVWAASKINAHWVAAEKKFDRKMHGFMIGEIKLA